ncbi:MAG: TolC family protein [Opitutaceae bacterium]
MKIPLPKTLAIIATILLPVLAVAERPVLTMPLDACIEQALQNNQRRPASEFAVAMAEAQHQQALSAYWPQVGFVGSYSHRSERPNFLFPSTEFNLPASTAVINVPAGVLGPSSVSLPVSVPAQSFETPALDVELLDVDSFTASLEMKWLLYDGGMRKGLRQQSSSGLEAARQAARLTELEIVDSVKRTYYGAVLAKQLLKLGEDTGERMEATLNLTETMYKEGAGGVNKTDYLSNKVMVDSIRAVVATLNGNEIMARAALANFMGLSWRDSVTPADEQLEFSRMEINLESLVGTAYRFSPNWARMEAGLDAAKGNIRTEKSGHQPRIALMGEVHQYWNSMDSGLSTNDNLKGWSLGVGMEIPIFDGFLVRNKVRHATAKLRQMEAQQILLEEGIGLQVRHIIVMLDATATQYQSTKAAMESATENRDLNERAYRNGLVETEEVIEAQLIESLMSARHYRVAFEYLNLLSQLDLVVGTEVLEQLANL